jgi:ABC-type Fe3+-hydroxamate transport system substrate-binding protein
MIKSLSGKYEDVVTDVPPNVSFRSEISASSISTSSLNSAHSQPPAKFDDGFDEELVTDDVPPNASFRSEISASSISTSSLNSAHSQRPAKFDDSFDEELVTDDVPPKRYVSFRSEISSILDDSKVQWEDVMWYDDDVDFVDAFSDYVIF